MNNDILNINIQDFIKNSSEDISKLAFAGSPFENVSVQELVQQIDCRNRIEKKLPTWFNKEFIYYPKKINLEQTSSEATASYKASLISGNVLADITGGFGVDTYYFSEKFESVQHFEHDIKLSEIAAHNFKVLGNSKIMCFAVNGLEKVLEGKYDVIYADPSRRHDSKGKVFFLKDCEPNIPENLSELLKHCKILMLKTSPMLDISAGLLELRSVYEIHIVAIDNEVKELIWLQKDGYKGVARIHTVNLFKNTFEKFDFNFNEVGSSLYASPKEFLYEPNAAIMKSGAFGLLSEAYNVHKLHINTHLYTSQVLTNFPGRRFKIIRVVLCTKALLRKELTNKKANITIRNFPESVLSLRKKWNISEGGESFLFFTTLENNQKVVIICSKVESNAINNQNSSN